jgi:hypothetical protein
VDACLEHHKSFKRKDEENEENETNMVGPQLSEKVVQSISKAIMPEHKSLDPNKLFRFHPCCNTSDPCTTMTSKIKKPEKTSQQRPEKGRRPPRQY